MSDNQQSQQECPGHVVKCARCKGAGVEPGFMYTPCRTCSGVGSVLLK